MSTIYNTLGETKGKTTIGDVVLIKGKPWVVASVLYDMVRFVRFRRNGIDATKELFINRYSSDIAIIIKYEDIDTTGAFHRSLRATDPAYEVMLKGAWVNWVGC